MCCADLGGIQPAPPSGTVYDTCKFVEQLMELIPSPGLVVVSHSVISCASDTDAQLFGVCKLH